MIYLPNVTLVLIDLDYAPMLAALALRDTLSQINPYGVITYSPRPLINNAKLISKPPGDLDSVGKILWYQVPFDVRTSHYLVIQYDSWVVDGSAWRERFLDYDYIGAPWWYIDFDNVGNGGFSLRSTKLGKYVAEHKDEFPFASPEDNLLCRNYKQKLPQFSWAPGDVAREFSFERVSVKHSTFGFHGIFNFPAVLSSHGLQQRIRYAPEHVKDKPEWSELLGKIRLKSAS